MIFVSFGKVQTAIFFDKINFENFLLIKVYFQNIKNWERASDIQELFKIIKTPYSVGARRSDFALVCTAIFPSPSIIA